MSEEEETASSPIQKERSASPSPSCVSMASDQSKEQPYDFHMDSRSQFERGALPRTSYLSMQSDRSIEQPVNFSPALPAQAGPGDVACDFCPGRKFRAVKSCLTCSASYCEPHATQHYIVEALQRHTLVEVTGDLDVHQENVQLKQMISVLQKENVEVKTKNSELKEEITELKEEITELKKRFSEPKLKKEITELKTPEYLHRGKAAIEADLTLDPDTARCELILSDDGKRVRCGEMRRVSDNPQRFDNWLCVLGSEGFSSGRHFWQVEVNEWWRIGVTRESVQRHGDVTFPFSPQQGYWCLHYWGNICNSLFALTDGTALLPATRLPETSELRVLGVCVDVEKRWVSFYNAESRAHIYTFTDMVFTEGEKIYPVFFTGDKN